MKIKIPKKITNYWSSYKEKFNTYGYNWQDKINSTPIGKLWWIVPKDVLWLYSTQNEECYEGSQTQFGVKKDGTIVWGYFSHCSCYGYEDYEGEVNELNDENEIHTRKTYELNNVDSGVLLVMKQRLKEISKIGLKDDAFSKDGEE